MYNQKKMRLSVKVMPKMATKRLAVLTIPKKTTKRLAALKKRMLVAMMPMNITRSEVD